MWSAPKILVCVAFVCLTTASTHERYGRSEVTGLLPYQWRLANGWENRRIPKNVGIPNYNILRVGSSIHNLNGRNDVGGQLGNALQSVGEYNIKQLPFRGSFVGENSGRELTNEGGLPRGNRYSDLDVNNFGTSSESGQRSWSRKNAQRRPQFSEGLRNSQNLQSTRSNIIRPSVGAKQIQLLVGIPLSNDQKKTLFANEDLNAQRTGIISSAQPHGYNQNFIGERQVLSENIQQNPSVPQWNNNGINTESLNNQKLGLISRNSFLRCIDDSSQNNNEEGQEAEINTEKNNQGEYSSENVPSEGNAETSSKSQVVTNFNQLKLNQFRDIQRETAGNNIEGQQFIYSETNPERQSPTRDGSGINTSLLQEVEEGKSQNIENNLEASSKKSQSEIEQNNIVQQHPNIYTYGELYGKIWKVIQSNPSISSNMEGLTERLLSNEDSGNQQIGQLKPLLREMGKYRGNPSSGTSLDGQQNPLIRNLIEVVNRNVNNQNWPSIPISFQGLSSGRS